MLALVEELACLRWHGLVLGMAAVGAGQHRIEDEGSGHLWPAEGKPASVVAFIRIAVLVLSASKVTLPVFDA